MSNAHKSGLGAETSVAKPRKVSCGRHAPQGRRTQPALKGRLYADTVTGQPCPVTGDTQYTAEEWTYIQAVRDEQIRLGRIWLMSSEYLAIAKQVLANKPTAA